MWSTVVKRDVAKQLSALERAEKEEETRARRERRAATAQAEADDAVDDDLDADGRKAARRGSDAKRRRQGHQCGYIVAFVTVPPIDECYKNVSRLHRLVAPSLAPPHTSHSPSPAVYSPVPKTSVEMSSLAPDEVAEIIAEVSNA